MKRTHSDLMKKTCDQKFVFTDANTKTNSRMIKSKILSKMNCSYYSVTNPWSLHPRIYQLPIQTHARSQTSAERFEVMKLRVQVSRSTLLKGGNMETFLLLFFGWINSGFGFEILPHKMQKGHKDHDFKEWWRKKTTFNVNVTSLKVMSIALMKPSQENSKNCKNVEGRNKGGNGWEQMWEE